MSLTTRDPRTASRWLRLIEVGDGILFPGQKALLSGFDTLTQEELSAAENGELVVGVISRRRGLSGRAGAWAEVGTEAAVRSLVRFPNGELGARVMGLGLFELASRPERRRGGYVAAVVGAVRPLKVLPS